MRPFATFAVLLAIALAAATPAWGREPEKREEPGGRELSEAKQALALGNVDEAIRLYRAFLDVYPGDVRAFWGLVNAYAAAGRDRDDLIPLLKERIGSHPLDMRAKQELGAAYARIGEHEKAHTLLMEALHLGTPESALYHEFGAIEVRNRMFEEAIELYLDGRRVFRDPALFGQELVQIHTLLGQYDKALDECLLLAENDPGLIQWATNRVEAMLAQGATRGEMEERMDAVAAAPRSSKSALAFAGSVYLVLDRPDRALGAYERADALEGRDGEMLLELANVLKGDGQLEEARQAFQRVAERYPRARTGEGAAVEAARLRGDLGDPAGAVAELKAVGDATKDQSSGGEALLEAARIELGALRDPAAALVTVKRVTEGGRRTGKQTRESAKLLEVDACLALGRFDDAYATATDVLAASPRQDARERAMFSLGLVSFLKLDLAKALGEFRSMVQDDTSGELVNDALRLMLIIADAEESGDPAAAALFASAQAARLSGDAAAARGHLEELARVYPGAPAAVEGLLLQGWLAADAGEYEGALRIYREVAADEGHLSARVEAMMRAGDILAENLGRTDDALLQYGAILEELPPNPLSGEARRKIEALRKSAGAEG